MTLPSRCVAMPGVILSPRRPAACSNYTFKPGTTITLPDFTATPFTGIGINPASQPRLHHPRQRLSSHLVVVLKVLPVAELFRQHDLFNERVCFVAVFLCYADNLI